MFADNVCHGYFARLRVWDPNNHCVLYARVGPEESFQLGGRDLDYRKKKRTTLEMLLQLSQKLQEKNRNNLVSSEFYEIFELVDKNEMLVFVIVTYISSVKPAILVDRKF